MTEPTLPIELIESIIDIVRHDTRTLLSLALVGQALRHRCQSHLFRTVTLVRSRPAPKKIMPLVHDKRICEAFLTLLSSRHSRFVDYVQRLEIVSFSSDCQPVVASILNRLSGVTEIKLAPGRGWLHWFSIQPSLREALYGSFGRLRVLELAYVQNFPSSAFLRCSLELKTVRMIFSSISADDGLPNYVVHDLPMYKGTRIRPKTLVLEGLSPTELSKYVDRNKLHVDMGDLENLALVTEDRGSDVLMQLISPCSQSLQTLKCRRKSLPFPCHPHLHHHWYSNQVK